VAHERERDGRAADPGPDDGHAQPGHGSPG
jgi:hypothetical protein